MSAPLEAYRASASRHGQRQSQTHKDVPSSSSRPRFEETTRESFADETISLSDAAGIDLPPLPRWPAWTTRTVNYVPPLPPPPPSPLDGPSSLGRSSSRLRKPPRAHVRASNASIQSDASDATKVEPETHPVPIMKKTKSSLSDASSQRTRTGTARSVKFATVPEVCYAYAYDYACACEYDGCECEYGCAYEFEPAAVEGDGLDDGAGAHDREGERWKESRRRKQKGLLARFVRWLRLVKRWRSDQRHVLSDRVKNPSGRLPSRPVISGPYPLWAAKSQGVHSKKTQARNPCVKTMWNNVVCH